MNKDKRNNIKLLGTLNNADESGIIANANQIYDANEDKSTQDVSKEHTERIKTLEDKEDSMQTTLENITKTGEASAASNVTYNHSDSKLDATNVQQAVDEVRKRSNYNDGDNIIDFNTIHIITDNPEFAIAVVDINDKILYGIKADGQPYWGVGVPKVVRDYVDKQVNDILGTDNITETIDSLKEVEKFLSDFKNSDTLKALLDTKANKIDVDNIIADRYKKSNPNDEEGNVIDTNSIKSVINNPEYFKAFVDNTNKLIEAIGLDGVRKFFAGINIQGISQCVIDNPDYTIAWVDKENRIIFAIQHDGNPYFGYGVPKQIKNAIDKLNVDVVNKYTEIKQSISETATDIDKKINLGNDVYPSNVHEVSEFEDNTSVLLDNLNHILESVGSDGVRKFFAGIEVAGNKFTTTDNPEYKAILLDKNNKILIGVKYDGSIYFGAGTPKQVKDYIDKQINKIQIGDVFDISAYHATGGTLATYADLSAALDGGNNIPQSLRKGGISVKFVQSSDNKYVQFRNMNQNWSTTLTDWQGVDEEPTAGSDNLVKSGGVFNNISQNTKTIESALELSDFKQTLSPVIVDDIAYINPQGRVMSGGGGFYTNPIILPSKYTIVVKAKGFLRNIAIISEVITDGSQYNPLVRSIDTTIREYSYTNNTDSDIQIALSGLRDAGISTYTVVNVKKLAEVAKAIPAIAFDKTLQYPLINPINETMDMLGIVKDWGFIGDSLNSGEIYYKRTSDNVTIFGDMYAWSWGQNICQLCGTVGTNFSVGGLTPKSWINRYWGTSVNGYKTGGEGETFNANPKQVYTICLGTNDINAMIKASMDAEARAAYIGSWEDVDINNFNNNADTFYGNYSGIIQRIKSIQPSAKIFLINIFSIFHRSDIRFEINAAISDIHSHFTNTFLVDLETLAPVSEAIIEKYGNGHFRVQGYMWFSYVIGNIINRIIRDNVSAFDSLPFIGIEGKDDGTL